MKAMELAARLPETDVTCLNVREVGMSNKDLSTT
jgi:hypothetical protein